MKGTSLIVSIVLFILIAGLYILHFTGNSSKTASSNYSGSSTDGKAVRIAYVKADSIIMNYKLSEVLHDDFTKKQEAYAGEYTSKRRSFEKDAVSFQEKIQRGGFLSEESAVRERNRLAGAEQEILRMEQELSGKLGEIQAANSQQVLDSLLKTIKRFNADKKYDYILNAASVLDGSEGANVTGDVLKMMNNKYIAPATK